MRITAKSLSIPPYISTSWNNIIALQVKNGELCLTLADNEIVKIPNLTNELIEEVFLAHSNYLEHESRIENRGRELSFPPQAPPPFIQALMASDHQNMGQMRFGFSTLDDAGHMMQHNPAQSDAPDIPFEILQKIAAIAKIVAPDDSDVLPKPEPHCNCMHCQLSRAIHGDTIEAVESITVEHAQEELPYTPWEVKQLEDKLYLVTNKEEPNEQYNVFLGEPVGCTCGVNGCKHILTVLRS